MILSTCNRVEVVAAAADAESRLSATSKYFSTNNECIVSWAASRIIFITYRGADAVRHLFRVAASLDSMVVGEPQILGQLKEYYDAAQQAGTVGTVLASALSPVFFGRQTGAHRDRHRQPAPFP